MIYTVNFEVNKMKSCDVNYCINYLKSKQFISLDTETEGFFNFVNKMLILQIGDYENQFIINPQLITATELNQLKNLLESKKIIIHNAKFDLKFLYWIGIDIKYIYDTFIAECLLTAGNDEKDLSLKNIAKKYLNIDLDKSVRGRIKYTAINEDIINYAANDIKYLEEIHNKQMNLIIKYDLQYVYNVERKLVRTLMIMELNGIKMDEKKWSNVYNITSDKVLQIEKELDNIVIDEYKKGNKKLYYFINRQLSLFDDINTREVTVNWASNQQKLQVLQLIGFDIDNTNNETLVLLQDRHKIVPLLIEYNKYNKYKTTYGKEFLSYINPITNRIHTNFWQILSTGRMSSQDPSLLNIPSHGELAESIKESFIAEDGYLLIDSDFSAIELRIIAELSGDPLWISIFNEDKDLHSILCSMTFNIPIEKVKDPFPLKPDLTYRFVQKTINFGLAYGMSKFKLANILNTTPEYAEEIINRFFSIVPKVKEFLDNTGLFGITNGFVRTPAPFKRIRFFTEKFEEAKKTNNKFLFGEIERASKNHPIQGANADITKTALNLIQDRIEDLGLDMKLLLSIHDAILVEANENIKDKAIEIITESMQEAAKTILKKVPVKIETVVGKHWKH